MSKSFKAIEPKIKVLAIYQLAGGGIGIALTAAAMVNYISNVNGLVLIFFCVALALYLYSIYCGVLLFKNYKTGLKHSFINQALQLMSVSFFGYSFQYIAGFYIVMGIDLTDGFLLTSGTGLSTWQMLFNMDDGSLFVKVNFVAIFLILFIEKAKKLLNEMEVEKQLSEMIVVE